MKRSEMHTSTPVKEVLDKADLKREERNKKKPVAVDKKMKKSKEKEMFPRKERHYPMLKD